jgi:hypothetical protein
VYKTCIYCNCYLGANEAVEHFPVGRQLAFDSGKGRLWVICENCRRWNLTPLEERWEAIEECERQFRETTLRLSTENIGLARLREGLDLVRIGKPLRPEFAAWRYGPQFLSRRVESLLRTAAATGAALGIHLLGLNWLLWFLWIGYRRRIVARVATAEGKVLPVAREDIKEVRLVTADTQEGWILRVPYRTGIMEYEPWRTIASHEGETIEITGSAAIRAAGKLLPKVNVYGGTSSRVRDAVGLIEEAGHPERFFKVAARKPECVPSPIFDKDISVIHNMRSEVRLALEMAAHEESERRALEGELEALEEEWRQAEVIAAIADRLLIPEEVEEWIREQKRLGESRER